MDAQIAKIEHVLVPIDGSMLSEQAIPYAHSLLSENGLITLLRVIPASERIEDPLGGTLLTGQEVAARYRVMAGQETVTAMDRWSADDKVKSEVVIESGDPATEILAKAKQRDVDLIVMASKGRGAFGRMALGSVTDRVARSAEVPVVVVRDEDALVDLSLPLIRRLIVPLDGSDLALKAVPVAAAMATAIHASIHFVTIVDFAKAAPPALAYGAAFSKQVYDEVMSEIEENARGALAKVVDSATGLGLDATNEVLTGKPAEAIMDVTKRGDLIVMSSHGHGGFKRLLLGSVAEKLVRHSPVPITIVPAHERRESTANEPPGTTRNRSRRVAALF